MSLFAMSLSLVGTILMLFFAIQEMKYWIAYDYFDYPIVFYLIGMSFLAFLCLICFVRGKRQRKTAIKIGIIICLLAFIGSLVLLFLDSTSFYLHSVYGDSIFYYTISVLCFGSLAALFYSIFKQTKLK